MVVELNGSKILRLPEVCQIVGLGRSTVYAKLAQGTFPVPVRLGLEQWAGGQGMYWRGWKTRNGSGTRPR